MSEWGVLEWLHAAFAIAGVVWIIVWAWCIWDLEFRR